MVTLAESFAKAEASQLIELTCLILVPSQGSPRRNVQAWRIVIEYTTLPVHVVSHWA